MNFKNILKNNISFSGVGLHTGKIVNITLKPTEVGTGIKFIRTDLTPHVQINADVANVTTTNRGTTLVSAAGSISTIEHLLAALNALEIEDVIIEADGPEIPILDGSSKMFIDKISNLKLEKVETHKDVFIISEPFSFIDELSGSEYAVFPSEHFELSAILEFSEDTLGDMVAVMKSREDFINNFADSRTFVFLTEVEPLFDAGLIKGGDIDNAVVIVDKKLSDDDVAILKVKLGKPNASIAEGVISSTPLRHRNEPARHKLLDILGDLTLLGRNVQAKIVATKPSHTGNIALTKVLKAKYQEYKKNVGRPIYDANEEPVMNSEQIKAYLPHRYPFLLVDKIIEVSDSHIVGVKNVTYNEEFFLGHFPDNPIFPGVLQMEALAQTGGIMALRIVAKEDEKWDTYFLKMDNVKFKAKVVPGDTLILKMELMESIRRGIVQMKGTAYVGNKIVSEGELTAQIVKRTND
jgi:UDP-3-O-[3-hydroxymyristoyl] N-acetylglucosamine deacetylase/3-hydroxyacyl-[acyl-carrier-protein] dehydratase